MPTLTLRKSTTILLLLFALVLAVTNLFPISSLANHVQCSDGVDNDNDGTADFPQDPDCSSTDDDSESPDGGASAQSSGASSSSLQLTLTDGRSAVRPGDSVIYVLTARNTSATTRTQNIVLDLPEGVEQISPDKGGRVSGNRVQWDDVILSQNQINTFTVQVVYKTTVRSGTPMNAVASSDGAQATDATVAQSSSALQGAGNFTVSITDNMIFAVPGERLNYLIDIQNTSSVSLHQDVILTISDLVDVHDIRPQTTNNANVIVWRNVSFQPHQRHRFTVEATVRSNTSDYVSVKAEVTAGATSASDFTTVRRSAASSSRRSSSRSSRSNRQPVNEDDTYILFSKSPDAQEVVAGGIIRYTLFIQNVLLNTIDDAIVTDRFDAGMLEVVHNGNANIVGDGLLQWNVPELGPGEIWQQEYSLRVLPHVRGNTIVQNIAGIGGSDVEYATLSERVQVVSTGVVGDLPATGAPYDVLYAVAVLFPAIGATILQRKSRSK